MRFADRLTGGIIGIFGILCFGEAYRLWTGWQGAGTMPIIVGSICIILAVFFVAVPIRKNEPSEFYSKKEILRISTISVSFAIYLIVIDWIGYSLSTWILLAIVTRATSTSRILNTLIWTGAVAAGTGIIFRKFLSVSLPVGFMGF